MASSTHRPGDRTQITRAILGLRELILSGEFAPGARVAELPLVDRLGVSRTPLRLALAELEHEGLLLQLPAGGYVVREFTRDDIRDAIELRGVLEGTAARFIAERGPRRAEVRALRAINDEIALVVHRSDYASFEGFLELNARFHKQLLNMARSPLLDRALESTLTLPFAGAGAMVLAQAELAESRDILIIAHRDHAALIEAFEGRQAERAESVAREHARLSLMNLDNVLRHRTMRNRLPGASLLALGGVEPEPEPV